MELGSSLLPLAPPPLPSVTPDEKRLWIGNIDSRLTEFNLVKILKTYGDVKDFDFLFHKTGPLKGQPRGYCFVTYNTRLEAERALQEMNGKMAISRRLVVKWANQQPLDEPSSVPKPQPSKPIVQTTYTSIDSQIKAIEAKLKQMKENPDLTPVTPPLYRVNNNLTADKPTQHTRPTRPGHHSRSQPYMKTRRR